MFVTVSVPSPCFTAVISPPSLYRTSRTLITPSGLAAPNVKVTAVAVALLSTEPPETINPFTFWFLPRMSK